MINNQTEQKEVIFVTSSLGSGGAERVISLLVNSFCKRNYKVTLFALAKDERIYNIDKRVDYQYIKNDNLGKVKSVICKIIELRRKIKNSKCKYIISFLLEINIYTIIACLFLGKKLIISERNDPYNEPKSRIKKIIRNLVYELADIVVFQTEEAKKYFSKRIQKKGVIILNPLNENSLIPYKKEKLNRIVSFCRLEPQKNLKMLIDAYTMLSEDFKDYYLEIYGQGSQDNYLKAYAKQVNNSGKIIFHGFTNNIYSCISDARIFVLPSNYEGLSNSMIEAMALGLVVICTDCPIGGARMIIKDKNNGILVPVGDTLALYKAIKNVIEDSEYEKKLSYNALKIRQQLDIEKISDKWEELIKI